MSYVFSIYKVFRPCNTFFHIAPMVYRCYNRMESKEKVKSMPQGKTLSENIADKIKSRIIQGEYALGSRLPNEQELSLSLNVSRTTIREAVKLLVSLHVLEIERGRGTFVAAMPGVSTDPLGLDFVADDVLLKDLLTFRCTMEPQVCALAAENATASQIAQMQKLIRKMEQLLSQTGEPPYDEKTIDAYTNNEIAFHTLVYQMTHNVIFERLTQLISRAVTISYTTQVYRSHFDLKENARTHIVLYEAIAAHDSLRARELGAEHMGSFARAMQD